MSAPDTSSLADRVGFEIFNTELGRDLKSAVRFGLDAGAVFPEGANPTAIFRATLRASIRDIETHARGRLLQDFLRKGPHEGDGPIPDDRLSDQDCVAAVAFVYAFMVNSFKGAIAELLAARACAQLLQRLREEGTAPPKTQLYVGEATRIPRRRGNGFALGADLCFLAPDGRRRLAVIGLAEVKSYRLPQRRLSRQLSQHLDRMKAAGLQVGQVLYAPDRLTFGGGNSRRALRISVVPATWKLPRSFSYDLSSGRRLLHVDRAVSPSDEDEVECMSPTEWRIKLNWSVEAIAEAAYDMTFWYMEKVGEVVYRDAVPKEWADMTPAEAGRNTVKMMLYYAIPRCRTTRDESRAVALYNAYGFGYALGMNFRNASGQREMLWPKDLDEILSSGKTKEGCRLY